VLGQLGSGQAIGAEQPAVVGNDLHRTPTRRQQCLDAQGESFDLGANDAGQLILELMPASWGSRSAGQRSRLLASMPAIARAMARISSLSLPNRQVTNEIGGSRLTTPGPRKRAIRSA